MPRHRSDFTVTGNANVTGDLEVTGDVYCDDVTADDATFDDVTIDALAVTDVALGNDLTIAEAGNVILGTATGTKIGTATTQKLGFYNATPIAKATGVAVTAEAIHAALVNLGLIGA